LKTKKKTKGGAVMKQVGGLPAVVEDGVRVPAVLEKKETLPQVDDDVRALVEVKKVIDKKLKECVEKLEKRGCSGGFIIDPFDSKSPIQFFFCKK
jgi:hypothetical protein